MMRAAVYEQYGPPEVLELRDVPKPTPKDDEVLVAIHATTVSAGDFRVRSMDVPAGFGLFARLGLGIFGPRQPILGSELAGRVEAIGKDVRAFAVGDPVFAFSDASMGCHAEYRSIREDGLIAHKPKNLSYEQAAALSFGGTTALHFLRKARVASGERVLVNGASGAVGSAAVQLARHFGAEVTGVCSTANLELVRSLGAAHVVDYTNEDFTQNGERYDVIVDTAGTAPFSRCEGSLTERGRLVLVLGTLGQLLAIPWQLLTTKKAVIAGVSLGKREELQLLADLAEAGEFKPLIDRAFSFDEIVEAHRYVDGGHKKGNVIVRLR